jgi:phytoene dehydrogenase-like protein
MAQDWDVVIIGGGHNGLVASFYLAQGGLRTLVLERRDILGGACVTEEFAPGFRASPGAYVLSMLREPVWKDLRLAERGLRVDQAGPSLNLYPDGQAFTLHADQARTIEEIRPLSTADAAAFPLYEEKMSRIAGSLMPVFDWTAPSPRVRSVHDFGELARFARLGFRHRRDVEDAAYLFTTSAKRRWAGSRSATPSPDPRHRAPPTTCSTRPHPADRVAASAGASCQGAWAL